MNEMKLDRQMDCRYFGINVRFHWNITEKVFGDSEAGDS